MKISVRRRLSELVSVVRGRPGLRRFTLILLAIDLLWIGFYAATRAMRALDVDIGVLGRDELRITEEGGIPEWFGYAQTLLVVIVAARLARSTGQSIYSALTLVYGLVLLDDSLAVHETLGGLLGPAIGVDDPHRGELLAWLVLAAVVTSLLAWGLRRSPAVHVEIGVALIVPVMALAVFAIGVDSLYAPFKDAFPGAGLLLDSVDDGGELITLTLACALALAATHVVGAIEDPLGPV